MLIFSVSLTSQIRVFCQSCRQFRQVLLPKLDVKRRHNGKQPHSIKLQTWTPLERRRFLQRASQICQMQVCVQQTRRTSVRFLFYSFLTKIISMRIEIEIQDSRLINSIITFARRDLQSEIVQFYTIIKVLIKFNFYKYK